MCSSNTCVPRNSVRPKSSAGRIDRSTWVSAAKLTIAVQSRAARLTSAGSAMSPSWNSTSSGRFARLPEYVSLSSTATSSPARSRRFAKCEPMKPAPPVTRTRIARRLVRGGRKPTAERAGQPPVPLAEQAHRRRDDQQPHERRIEQDRNTEARPQLLQRGRAGDDEGEEDGHHDESGARDDASRAYESFCDGAFVVTMLEPALAHARQQEDLIVHRESEGHREHERG